MRFIHRIERTLAKDGEIMLDGAICIVKDEKKDLQHYYDTTVGLWVTDRPEKIPENIKKEYFFELK